MNWEELLVMVSRPIGSPPLASTFASFAYGSGGTGKRIATPTSGFAPFAYPSSSVVNTPESLPETSAYFADVFGGPEEEAEIASPEHFAGLDGHNADDAGVEVDFVGTEVVYAKDAKPRVSNVDQPLEARLEEVSPEPAWAIAGDFIGVSADEWQADLINRTFAKYGVLGQPARITAATVRHGRLARQRGQRIGSVGLSSTGAK
jgi:hypothetical protein